MDQKSILNPAFQYRDRLNTNLHETFERARQQIGEQRVIKVPPVQTGAAVREVK